MTTLRVTLPWPDAALSPNSRGHWSKRYKASKQARRDAALLTADARNRSPNGWYPAEYVHRRLKVSLTFYEPDRRRRDDDNLMASMKPALDGVSDALGVNDSQFDIVKLTRTVAEKGTEAVVIEIST